MAKTIICSCNEPYNADGSGTKAIWTFYADVIDNGNGTANVDWEYIVSVTPASSGYYRTITNTNTWAKINDTQVAKLSTTTEVRGGTPLTIGSGTKIYQLTGTQQKLSVSISGDGVNVKTASGTITLPAYEAEVVPEPGKQQVIYDANYGKFNDDSGIKSIDAYGNESAHCPGDEFLGLNTSSNGTLNTNATWNTKTDGTGTVFKPVNNYWYTLNSVGTFDPKKFRFGTFTNGTWHDGDVDYADTYNGAGLTSRLMGGNGSSDAISTMMRSGKFTGTYLKGYQTKKTYTCKYNSISYLYWFTDCSVSEVVGNDVNTVTYSVTMYCDCPKISTGTDLPDWRYVNDAAPKFHFNIVNNDGGPVPVNTDVIVTTPAGKTGWEAVGADTSLLTTDNTRWYDSTTQTLVSKYGAKVTISAQFKVYPGMTYTVTPEITCTGEYPWFSGVMTMPKLHFTAGCQNTYPASTMYAIWQPLPVEDSYIVTYDKGDATSGNAPASQLKLNGVNLELYGNEGNLSKLVTDTTSSTNKTLSILYNLNDEGSSNQELPDLTQNINVNVNTSSDTTYAPNGWTTSVNGSKAYDFGGEYSTDADITLYPAWDSIGLSSTTTIPTEVSVILQNGNGLVHSPAESDSTGLTIEFDLNGGDGSVDNLTGTCSTTNEYRLIGWNTVKNPQVAGSNGTHYELGGNYNTILTTDTTDTLYAEWELHAKSVEGVTLTIPDIIPTKLGYKFIGWVSELDDNSNPTVFEPGNSYLFYEDQTLIAQWEKHYVVTYELGDASAGIVPEAQTKFRDEPLTLAYNTLGKDSTTTDVEYQITVSNLPELNDVVHAKANVNYTADGWNSGTTTYTSGGIYTENADVTLVPAWSNTIVNQPGYFTLQPWHDNTKVLTSYNYENGTYVGIPGDQIEVVADTVLIAVFTERKMYEQGSTLTQVQMPDSTVYDLHDASLATTQDSTSLPLGDHNNLIIVRNGTSEFVVYHDAATGNTYQVKAYGYANNKWYGLNTYVHNGTDWHSN